MTRVHLSSTTRHSLQEDSYGFPYHYIPNGLDGDFSQTKHWSWGYRYLGGIQVVSGMLNELQFASAVDIGCGDGRLLGEFEARYEVKRLLGVDYSERAVAFARAMNSGIEFRVADLLSGPLDDEFDLAVLMEVLEHIELAQVPTFLQNVSNAVKPDGYLVLTVPHSNKPINPKHFQHFTSRTLEEALTPHFRVSRFVYFDTKSRLLNLLQTLLGGAGRNYIITHQSILNAFFKLYLNRYLYADSELQCHRIAAICRRIS